NQYAMEFGAIREDLLKQETKETQASGGGCDRGSLRRVIVGGPAREAELKAGTNQRLKERQRGRERVAVEKMDDDGGAKRCREDTIGIGRAKAVGGKRGPVCRWIALPVACQFPPPVAARPRRPLQVALTEEAGEDPKLTAIIASGQAAREAAVYEDALNVRGGTKPESAASRGNESNFASARRRCVPGRQGIPRSRCGADMMISSIPCCFYFLGEKRQDADPACR
ncbi:uncharacterized protein TRIREDRAFT_110816, partial [Trichoderma reesei QM6a]